MMADMKFGPVTPAADAVHAAKYRGRHESFREATNRVASAISDGSVHYGELREMMGAQRWSPAGRIWSGAGAAKAVTLLNCYHSGPIEDSLLEGDGSIMKRLTEAMATLRMGGGIGYNFSLLRPNGALIKKLGSHSCGPVRFIEMFDAAGGTISSSGERRGAQMGMLRVDHPDIMEFIRCKQGNPNYLTRFNLSVQVTDEFMEALAAKRPFKLRHGGQEYGEVDPEELWETMMRSTWDWGDPGVFFIDRINGDNNLRYCEEIIGSNPCGEVPLPAFGSCLLGSHNLAKYLTLATHSLVDSRSAPLVRNPMGRLHDFDWDQFREDIPVAIRAMDNVIDVTTYPLYEQGEEMRRKRRIGLGFTGLANAGEAQGWAYGSPEFVEFAEKVTVVMRDEAYRASAKLAKERGAFPLFDFSRFKRSRHFQELSADVQELIERHGLRNSHLISIAPTGTISLAMDNVSSGLEPVFEHEGQRFIRFPSSPDPQLVNVQDYGWGHLGVRGKKMDEVTLQEHIDVLKAVSKSVDQSVSKTINVGKDVTWEQFQDIYMQAYQSGCKSCTTFRPSGKKMGILIGKAEPAAEEGMQCSIDPQTGQKECA
jgi:ribonucleoside-diphosphate reductase alpha chain